MDCDMISYGAGTPVAKGFDQYEVIEIINQIIKSRKVVCFEVVEVNPLLERKQDGRNGFSGFGANYI
jgi:arginase